MHGTIAAGSAPTAEAGARILARGGNAVDAAVAACFATSAGEPTLTSLAGAGVMIYRNGQSGAVEVCDFFADAPSLGPNDVEALDFHAVDLDFGPTTQRFYIGAGAAAVPGVIPGICSALERWGSMPLSAVVEPACSMLREGVELGPYQGRAAKLLEPILTYGDHGRAIFAPGGQLIRAGDRFKLVELADTLEAMAALGWERHYREVLSPAMLAQFGPARGGLLLPQDLAGYEVRFAAPLELHYRGARVLTMPAPAAGGAMIGLMLAVLDGEDLASLRPLDPDHVRRLCCVMALADEARREGASMTAIADLGRWQRRYRELVTAPALPRPPAVPALGGTTHVSVIDAAGNAAAVTFSYGEGNAHIIDGTGIMMNNLMGEEDLHPEGFGKAPRNQRLNTMMSPTLVLEPNGSITVLGTGGANRIRSAIVQIVSLLLDYGRDAQSAVGAPRVHYEGGVLNAEVFELGDAGASLLRLEPAKLVAFAEPSLFFGGVHLVRRLADGTLDGAGDPRRGGVCRVV